MIDGTTVCEMHNNLQSSKNLISISHAAKGIESVLKLERHGEDEASERETRHDLEKVHQQSRLIQTECIIGTGKTRTSINIGHKQKKIDHK